MAVYVIVIALAVLLLIAAYRTLGGSAVRPVDASALLRSLHVELGASVEELSLRLQRPGATDRDEEVARTGRRRSAAVQQTLDQLPPESELDDEQLAVRALLAAAAEDCAWAWRMVPVLAGNGGLTAAAAALHEHAARCCSEAAQLLPAATAGEPADRV